ncbi:uncharacterized protein Dere_GG26644 [Drosophila erecta]|uniref:Dynein 2 heavy chain 1 cytoplasmic ATPase lid domain-containing protein n=1 Tax=Drosophila erecta TaxID=7220 RepID=A0A0Q5VY22_DROER|nr:uncharacterized protein Dere_GG26644 [Drosophila erecta]
MGIVNMSYDYYPADGILKHELSKEPYGDLLQSYVEGNFPYAVNWMEGQLLLTHLPGINRVHLLRSLLLQLRGSQSLEEYGAATLRALFGYMPNDRQREFAQLILKHANLYVANPNYAELTHYESSRNSLEQYPVDAIETPEKGSQLIITSYMKSYLDILETLLKTQGARIAPFMLIGPSGSGKTLLLQRAVLENSGYQLATINCSTQLTPRYILHTLKTHCVTVSGVKGREYRPKQARLVLFMKNLDLCQQDSWGASEVVELLLQLAQRGGFYAENLEWIGVSGLQICASIGANSGKIAPRYYAINQFVRVSRPTSQDMLEIVQRRLEPLLEEHFRGSENRGRSGVNLQHVSESLMDCFEKLQATFTNVGGRQAHYQFSPKCIMKLLDALVFYPASDFNEALYCELLGMFRDRLISEEHVQQFEGVLKQTMRKYCGKEKVFFVPKSPKARGHLRCLTHDEWMEEVQRQVTICSEY